ncbi:hypothetical protein [Kitasatospora sp. MMS16-BH015]|uniref:hypothetical protein n=1 Tax=Kitasatospora sp. MMS16-BH015 TaxID=2018025 RepID=UPI00131A5C6C|nr:hypothetical protein [Kitasatospora sp. MMS16-BH015]
MRQIDLDTAADTAADTSTEPARKAVRKPARLRRRLAFTLVGALAAAAVVGGVMVHDRSGSGLGSSELATWTTKPTLVDTSKGQGATTLKWCLHGMPGEGTPTAITNADLRGKVTSMVVSRGGTTALCYVASERSGFWESVGEAKTVARDTITYDTGGSHGSGADTFNYAAGFAGADVKAVTMTAQGHTFEVTVDSGRWTAWWPGSDVREAGVIDSATLTFADGTTRTLSGKALFGW